MGHGKLRKFAENETFDCLVQPDAREIVRHDSEGKLLLNDHSVKGRWAERFASPGPISLELGCGKGEYTIALARLHPERNFIGVDIKGARLWKGAREATLENIGNVGFLRTRIEFIPAFFAPGEVSSIWLTFSDPQLRGSENARLSSPMFLERYRKFLAPGGVVHLKTDSRFLYEYTLAVVRENGLPLLASGTDIYGEGISCGEDNHEDLSAVTAVQTFYESMFLEMGLPICYLAFRLDGPGRILSPEHFDADYWREAEGPRRSFGHQREKQNKD